MCWWNSEHSIHQRQAIISSRCVAPHKQAVTSLNYQLGMSSSTSQSLNQTITQQHNLKTNQIQAWAVLFPSLASCLIEWRCTVVALFLEQFHFDVSRVGGWWNQWGRLTGKILQISLFGNDQHSRRHQTWESLKAEGQVELLVRSFQRGVVSALLTQLF